MQYDFGRQKISEVQEDRALGMMDELGDDYLCGRTLYIYRKYLESVTEQYGYTMPDIDSIICRWNTRVTCTLGYHKRRGNQHIIELTHRLLLLDEQVIDTVILHELCHCLEPNHGPGFWFLVKQANDLFYRIDQRIRHGFKSVIEQYSI